MPRKSTGLAIDTVRPESRPLDGRTRQAKALKAAERERNRIMVGLLAGMGRTPSEIDVLAAKNAAGLQVEVDRLEARGADASEPRRLLVQLLRASGLRPQPIAVPEKQPVDWESYLKRTAAKPADAAEGPTC